MKLPEQIIYAFEGLDGAGKTTTIRFLRDRLTDEGYSIEVRRHPSLKGFVGNLLANHMAEQMPQRFDKFFVYDLERSTRERPRDIDIMLWDRYLDSIYTSNIHSDYTYIRQRAIRIPEPKRIFLMDLSPELAWQREGNITDHPLTPEWLSLKEERYKEILAKESQRYTVIDTNKPQQQVFEEVFDIIKQDIEKNGRK